MVQPTWLVLTSASWFGPAQYGSTGAAWFHWMARTFDINALNAFSSLHGNKNIVLLCDEDNALHFNKNIALLCDMKTLYCNEKLLSDESNVVHCYENILVVAICEKKLI